MKSINSVLQPSCLVHNGAGVDGLTVVVVVGVVVVVVVVVVVGVVLSVVVVQKLHRLGQYAAFSGTEQWLGMQYGLSA